MSEHTEQCAVMDWANLHAARYPVLRLLYATPNGGKRHIKTAIDLGREGVKRGVPDLHLAVPRRHYHSLWIEMKFGRNKLTPEQEWWIDTLRAQDNKAETCYSTHEAVRTIYFYLGLDCKCELCQSLIGVKP